MIFQTESALRFLGWSGNDRLLAAVADEFTVQPTTVKLLSLTLAGTGASGKTGSIQNWQNWLGSLSETYWVNLHLSPNGQGVAFVKAPNGRNDIWLAPIYIARRGRPEGGARMGAARKLTNNGDPSFFFSSLAWSPDGKTIYYDKQTRWNLLTMIENLN